MSVWYNQVLLRLPARLNKSGRDPESGHNAVCVKKSRLNHDNRDLVMSMDAKAAWQKRGRKNLSESFPEISPGT